MHCQEPFQLENERRLWDSFTGATFVFYCFLLFMSVVRLEGGKTRGGKNEAKITIIFFFSGVILQVAKWGNIEISEGPASVKKNVRTLKTRVAHRPEKVYEYNKIQYFNFS